MGTPVDMVLSAFLVEKVGIELLRPQLSQMSHASLGTGQVIVLKRSIRCDLYMQYCLCNIMEKTLSLRY